MAAGKYLTTGLGALTNEEILALTTDAIKTSTNDAVKTLSPAQIALFSPNQMGAFTKEHIIAFSPQQIMAFALSPEQIRNLELPQFTRITSIVDADGVVHGNNLARRRNECEAAALSERLNTPVETYQTKTYEAFKEMKKKLDKFQELISGKHSPRAPLSPRPPHKLKAEHAALQEEKMAPEAAAPSPRRALSHFVFPALPQAVAAAAPHSPHSHFGDGTGMSAVQNLLLPPVGPASLASARRASPPPGGRLRDELSRRAQVAEVGVVVDIPADVEPALLNLQRIPTSPASARDAPPSPRQGRFGSRFVEGSGSKSAPGTPLDL